MSAPIYEVRHHPTSRAASMAALSDPCLAHFHSSIVYDAVPQRHVRNASHA
ncbi:hypothetical protein ACF3NX_12460 [Acetobacter orientalis]|uniref:hypothetical protein n=1 Tax=Acetobacter orientalis TaxID=146474 RepID=UPI0038635BF0